MGFKSTKDVQSFDLLLAILYEFLGTFILVAIAIGSGSNAPDDIYPRDTLRTPFTVGLTVATVVWAGSHVSGAHVNPVVSFAFLITHNISLLRFVLFTVSQLLGATTAALFIQSLSPPGFNDLVGVQVLGKGVLWHQGFLIETLTTFLLIFVILATTDDHRSTPKGSGPLTIGLCVTLCQLWSLPFTGGAMNPARSTSSHIVSGFISHYPYIWVYWAGPFLGSLLASLSYHLLFAGDASRHKLQNYLSNFFFELL